MRREYTDGWHTLKGFRVYIENGMVVRGLIKDHNGEDITAHPYYSDSKTNGWNNVSGKVKADTFRRSDHYTML